MIVVWFEGNADMLDAADGMTSAAPQTTVELQIE